MGSTNNDNNNNNNDNNNADHSKNNVYMSSRLNSSTQSMSSLECLTDNASTKSIYHYSMQQQQQQINDTNSENDIDITGQRTDEKSDAVSRTHSRNSVLSGISTTATKSGHLGRLVHRNHTASTTSNNNQNYNQNLSFPYSSNQRQYQQELETQKINSDNDNNIEDITIDNTERPNLENLISESLKREQTYTQLDKMSNQTNSPHPQPRKKQQKHSISSFRTTANTANTAHGDHMNAFLAPSDIEDNDADNEYQDYSVQSDDNASDISSNSSEDKHFTNAQFNIMNSVGNSRNSTNSLTTDRIPTRGSIISSTSFESTTSDTNKD